MRKREGRRRGWGDGTENPFDQNDAPPPPPPLPPPTISPARLPGLGVESSLLGWAALSGGLDEFGPADYLGPNSLAPDSAPEAAPVDAHSAMEAALRLGTAPVARRV